MSDILVADNLSLIQLLSSAIHFTLMSSQQINFLHCGKTSLRSQWPQMCFSSAFNGITSAVLWSCFNFPDCSSKCNVDFSLTLKNFALSVSWSVATLSGVKTMLFTIIFLQTLLKETYRSWLLFSNYPVCIKKKQKKKKNRKRSIQSGLQKLWM